MTSSQTLRDVIRHLFVPADQDEAARSLATRCSRELATDRIRYSILKLSNGKLDALRTAVGDARTDWRDVLVWAGFGDSLTAHREWAQRVRSAAAMTAFRWNTCADSRLMLLALHRRADERKLRLFAADFARRALPRMRTEENRPARAAKARRALEVVERFLAGEATADEVAAAYPGNPRDPGFDWWDNDEANQCTADALRSCLPGGKECAGAAQDAAEHAVAACPLRSRPAERATQAATLRELFGNPFRPATVDPVWLTCNGGVVSKLARAIDRTDRFEDLPVLADALEDAGCANEDVLRHCRRQGGHARGCWLIDLLLESRP